MHQPVTRIAVTPGEPAGIGPDLVIELAGQARNAELETPLGIAVGTSGGQTADLARVLLAAGAEVNAADKDERTPLLLAVKSRQRLGVIRLLLDAGADVASRDMEGNTALSLAQDRPSDDHIVALLLEAGGTDPKMAVRELHEAIDRVGRCLYASKMPPRSCMTMAKPELSWPFCCDGISCRAMLGWI